MKCCTYTAGMLKEPVTFQRETRTADGIGGSSKVWATIATAPTLAHVRPLSGYEASQASRLNAGSKLMVVTRYSEAMTEADSVLIRGKRHNIRYIKNVDLKNRWLEIDVDGGVAV